MSLENLRAYFTRLSELLRAGIGLYEALNSMKDFQKDKTLIRFTDEMILAIEEGRDIFPVLKKYEPEFGQLFTALFDTGYQTGLLSDTLKRLAQNYERELFLKRSLKRGIAYPAFLIIFFIFVSPLPLIFTSGFAIYLKKVLLDLTIIAVLISIYYIITYFAKEKFKYFFDVVKINLPLFGKPIRLFTLSRGLNALAIGLKSGLSVDDILRLIAASFDNLYLKNRFLKDIKGKGKFDEHIFTKRFSKLPIVTNNILSIINTGEKTGNLDELSASFSEQIEKEAFYSLKNATKIFSIMVFLLVAVMMAINIIKFWVNYYRMIK